MVLETFCVYLALAALFYLGLTVKAVNAPLSIQDTRHKWQRTRHMKESALRRFRPLLALRLLKRRR